MEYAASCDDPLGIYNIRLKIAPFGDEENLHNIEFEAELLEIIEVPGCDPCDKDCSSSTSTTDDSTTTNNPSNKLFQTALESI